MFTREKVLDVIEELKKRYPCFASEAHFQMMFTFEAEKLFAKQFEYYPEWPLEKEHIDLMIVDNNTQERTFIEFKYKTKNSITEKKVSYILPPDVEVTPSNMGARPIAKYDCWKDIEGLESFVEKKESINGFFIFLTNDPLYWKEIKESKAYGNGFSIEEGDHECKFKEWKQRDGLEIIVGKKRISSIENRSYKDDKSFKYLGYSKMVTNNKMDLRSGEFKVLIVDI